MCINFYDIHASAISRILRVKHDPKGAAAFHGVGKSKDVPNAGYPSLRRGRKRGANARR